MRSLETLFVEGTTQKEIEIRNPDLNTRIVDRNFLRFDGFELDLNYAMKFLSPIIVFSLFLGIACDKADVRSPTNPASDATAPLPKDGDYSGSGVITKIDYEIGSVEMDHGDIPGLMPAMRMEFYVLDKALLTGLAAGDSVDFTILYRGGTETITNLAKSQ